MKNSEARQVDGPTRFFYGLGSVAYGVKDNGFAFFLLLYYNQVLGLPSHLTSLAIFAALFVDALSDPIVGTFSDSLRSRWGRRHPFMYGAAFPVAISFYFLWNPPALSESGLFYYLLFSAIGVRTFLTFFEIPSTALAPELTSHYDERTTLSSIRYFFGWAGGTSMALIAYRFLLVPTPEQPTGQLNAAGYEAYGLLGSGMMLISILGSALGTHRTIPRLVKPAPRKRRPLRVSATEIRQTLARRSFGSIFGYGIFSSMANGFASAMSLYLNTYYWELSTSQLFWIVSSGLLSIGIALPLAPYLSERLGKKRAAISMALGASFVYPVPILSRWLGWAPDNGSPELVPYLIFWNVLGIAMIITMQTLVSAMISDVVDESELETGRRSEGIFFAARSFITKSLSGFGIVLVTLLLATIGFPENAQPGEVDARVVKHLGLGFIPIIALLYGIAMAFLSTYGLDRDQHEANLERLRRRRAGAEDET